MRSLKVKALDTETMESYTWDIMQCPKCEKWLVDNPNHKYCCFCGELLEAQK